MASSKHRKSRCWHSHRKEKAWAGHLYSQANAGPVLGRGASDEEEEHCS